MQGLPAIVSFQAPGTEAQRRWLQCTRIPLASIIFGPSGGPHPDEGGLAQLPLVDATCLTASERTLLSITGLEAQSATPEQFAVFSRRFAALQVLRLNLPTDSSDMALRSLPRGLRHLGANAADSSFQARLHRCALLLRSTRHGQ